jgi:hypothetical protein
LATGFELAGRGVEFEVEFELEFELEIEFDDVAGVPFTSALYLATAPESQSKPSYSPSHLVAQEASMCEFLCVNFDLKVLVLFLFGFLF